METILKRQVEDWLYHRIIRAWKEENSMELAKTGYLIKCIVLMDRWVGKKLPTAFKRPARKISRHFVLPDRHFDRDRIVFGYFRTPAQMGTPYFMAGWMIFSGNSDEPRSEIVYCDECHERDLDRTVCTILSEKYSDEYSSE